MKFQLSKRLMIGLVGLGAVATLGACAQPAEDTAMEDTATEDTAMEDTATEDTDAAYDEPGTIVAVASGNESFDTLVQALDAAELTDTLAAEGPYTVFAPSDEAFAALPEGTLDQLLQPENQETLTQVLTYHVVPQAVMSSDITPGEVATVAGPPVEITVDESTGNVMVNGAQVVQTDVEASNGVIHVIDQVILPPDVEL